MTTAACALPGAPVLGGATWQRCQFHLARNAIHHAPNAETRKRIGRQLKSIWKADDLNKAETALAELVASYRDPAPKLAAWLEENVPEGLAVFTLPEHHRKRLRTSNPMERSIQQELKRRTVKVRVFPGEDALLRLVSAVLVEIDEKMGLRHKGLHQVGMPGCMIRSQQNFQTTGCSIHPTDRKLR